MATNRRDELLQKIHAVFPDLMWKVARYLDEGWDHEVIILDNSIVFRFPDDEEYTDLLPIELDVLDDLQQRVQVNIPKYVYIAPDKSFAGYMIVPGRQISKRIYEAMPEERQSEFAGQLADFLTQLHTIQLEGNEVYTRVQPSYMRADQEEVKHDAAQFLPGVLNAEEMAIVQQIIGTVDALVANETHVRFIHGDVYSKHLLWDDTRQKLGVIDFSDMMRGDPAIDFAELHEYGDDFVNLVYEKYAGPKDATFLERTWIYQCWVGVYMLNDHFKYHKTSFAVARETFDRVRENWRGLPTAATTTSTPAT